MGDSTPICRCRVLYLGSAVPRQSKDGLQGIQEPLRSLYPSEGAVGAKGIDSWLSVWSNGILLENVDENLKQITRFFPIESLHYCAAVRQVLIPERGNSNPEPKFLPLDSPFARMPRAQHPPIFAAILRRTTGIKVLECHVFICKREAAANALVRCCFHAYADNSYARQLETGSMGAGAGSSVYGTLKSGVGSKSNGDLTGVGLANGNSNHHHHHQTHLLQQQQLQSAGSTQGGWRSRAGSTTTLNSVGRQSNGHIVNGSVVGNDTVGGNGGAGGGTGSANEGNRNGIGSGTSGGGGGGSNSSAAEGYTSVKNFYGSSGDLNVTVDDGDASIYNGDENHKVWNGSQDQLDSIALGMESSYEVYGVNASTLGRPARARQMSTPIEVAPPPMKEEHNRKKKDKRSTKQTGSQSLSGTLIRPKPIHAGTLQRPLLHNGGLPSNMIYGPVAVTPHSARQYHTISHRGFPPGLPIAQHPHLHPGIPPQSHHHLHQQMLPALGIPLPMPVVVPQQYATLQPPHTTSKKSKKKDKKGNSIPVGMPIVPPVYGYHQPLAGPVSPPLAPIGITQSLIGEQRPLAMSSRKLAASMGNGLDDSGTSGAESPGGTGIYRRKGHLNERAFSYSIRQEHRSRSHGSLASLQFNPPDMKKEREIAQMVAGLDLNDSDERSMGPATLQRKHQASLGNGIAPIHHQQQHQQQHQQYQHHHHHNYHPNQQQQQQQQQAIYGNGGAAAAAAAIYGNSGGPSNSFGKSRR